MNLKDLSKVVTESIQECIDRKVSLEDVDVYIINGEFGIIANNAQLRFSDLLDGHGVLILDRVE